MNYHLSIVSPVYNESQVLVEFLDQLVIDLEALSVSFEIIIVNDGSHDNTIELLEKSSQKDPRIKSVNFSRNFGQHAAIAAGIQKALGDFIVVMDGDLQDNPKAIQNLLLEAQNGFDIVFVARLNRKVSKSYRHLQRFFYSFLNALSDLSFDSRLGNFSIISRRVQESYLGLNGSISYYPAALNWLGFKSSVIMYEQGNRRAGSKTKYNFKSRARLAIEVIISHSRKPLRLAIFLGTFMAAVGLGLGILVFVMYLNNTLSQPGWASLFVAIVTLSGIQLFTLGIFGLYIGEIANSTQNKPQFVILKD